MALPLGARTLAAASLLRALCAAPPPAGAPAPPAASAPTPPLLSWRPLGEPGCGGDITAVRVNPFNTSQIFVAGDMLGVGVSLDGGASFSAPPSDAFLSYEMNDFTFEPVLARVYVASASGPYYANLSTPLEWASIREGFPAVDSAFGAYPAAVQVVLVDPSSQGRRLLALGGSKRGWPRVLNGGVVWESEDAGASWRNATSVAPAGAPANVVAAAWSGEACVWAAVSGVGMARSLDGGRSWATRWPAGRSTALASGAAHPTDCDTAYAAMADDGSVAKTTDGGVTWADASAGLPTGGSLEAFGTAAEAGDPETLFAGNSNHAGAAFVSRDGGASWAPTGAPPAAQAFGLGMQSSFLSVHPSDRDTVLYATWVTLWRSVDGGATWTDLTARAGPGDATGTLWSGTGFGGLVATNVAFNPFTSALYPFRRAFIQAMDAGKIWAATDAGAPPTSWRRQTGLNLFGGGNALAFAADGTTIFAGTGQYGWPAEFSTEGVVKSLDGGDTWAYSCGAPSLSGSTEVTALCVTPANASNVWAVFQDGRLYYSADACKSWALVEEVNDTITGLVCPEPGTPSALAADPAGAELYAAGQRGVWATGPAWRSGADWALIPGGPTAWQYSTSWCKIAPADAPEPRLVCANAWWDQWHSGLWRLNLTQAQQNVSGASWSWAIHDSTVYRWTAAPGTAGRVQAYATNENPFPERCDATGVYLSTDSGQTWSREVAGLRMRRVAALEFSPDGKLLIAGLNGGGFYVADTSGFV